MDLTAFRAWLTARHYSDSTIRNYLADTNRYLSFAGDNPLFSEEVIKDYLHHLSTDSNAKRYLASLNQFCQFALDQRLVSRNPLKIAQKQLATPPKTTFDDLLQQYQKYLEQHKVSPITIKNYLGDIKQYLSWVQTPQSSGQLPFTGEPTTNKKFFLFPPLSRGGPRRGFES